MGLSWSSQINACSLERVWNKLRQCNEGMETSGLGQGTQEYNQECLEQDMEGRGCCHVLPNTKQNFKVLGLRLRVHHSPQN